MPKCLCPGLKAEASPWGIGMAPRRERMCSQELKVETGRVHVLSEEN